MGVSTTLYRFRIDVSDIGWQLLCNDNLLTVSSAENSEQTEIRRLGFGKLP